MKTKFDFGRSNTRMVVDGNWSIIDSSYVKVGIDENIRKDVKDLSGEFIVRECPFKALVGNRYAKGESMSLYSAMKESADENDKKTFQLGTYLNLAYSVALELLNQQETEDDCIELAALIPAKEYFKDGAEVFKSNVAGAYVIEFIALGKVVSFTIEEENIKVGCEGYTAWLTLTQTDLAEFLADSTGLIIDAGCGSDDIIPVVNGVPIADAADSFKKSGAWFSNRVMKELEDNRITATEGNVKTAIEAGYVKKGLRDKQPVGEIVNRAKEKLADYILKDIEAILRNASLTKGEIQWIYCLGRCFVQVGDSDYCTGKLSDHILDKWEYDIDVIEPLPVDDDIVEQTGSTAEVAQYELANLVALDMIA